MRLLVLTLAGLLLAPVTFAQAPEAGAPAKAPTSKAHVLKKEELDKLLATPDRVLLIDVRRPDEVSTKGGFPVYLSIQLNALEQSLASIPKNRTIVTVSNHAGRAGKAADLLAAHGFKVAGAVGTETYESEGGHAVTRIVPPSAAASAAAAPAAAAPTAH
jgi:rhodanese-related sulfurtransferase